MTELAKTRPAAGTRSPMITPAPARPAMAGRETAAAAGAQLVLLGTLWAAAGLGPAAWAAGVLHTFALWAILTRALRRAGLGTLGPADRVTLARAVLAGGVTALVVERAESGVPLLALTALAAMALLLDGVDGKVARRTGTCSPFGARFDMEVDAFLILALSVHVAASTGPWVLAIGMMRYAFVAAAWALPWLGGALPPRLARKVVAALQGVVLVVAGTLPYVPAALACAAALAALVWSFGRDVAWLRRHGRAG
ncbi:CDP-alcohol phosphatidyltransferase family protein [Actinomadura sp. 9N407]|uniref:CDP-alcohol phosphatidyltransferase family protein n=1 Tax=Actinomadura sp. 9N407 TaxID=3375154 RepID=UPI00378EA65E